MPWFEYDGLTPGGTAIAGRLEASELDQAREDLAGMHIEVRQIQPAAGPPKRTPGLTADDLIFFNEQLASLAQAGLALDEGLAQLARDLESSRLRRWIGGLVEDLRRGMTLEQAIAAREASLPLLYSRVIRAGVESGQLPATLLNLNQHLRLASQTRRMLWEVLSYPLAVGMLALGVISLFFGLVVPRFREIFADFSTDLPALTVLVIHFGELYPKILAVGVAVLLAVILAWRFLLPGEMRVRAREAIVLRLPVIGRVHRASLIARFLRAVSAAVSAQVPLPGAMRMAAGATGSPLLLNDAERLAGEVEQGQPIFTASQSLRLIPPLFGFCVQVAVGREALPTALAQLSRSYENRAMHTQALLRTLLFPALILVLGGVIGIGIVAMFLPLISLINSVSSGG